MPDLHPLCPQCYFVDDDTCVHCGRQRVRPDVQGYIARRALDHVKALLRTVETERRYLPAELEGECETLIHQVTEYPTPWGVRAESLLLTCGAFFRVLGVVEWKPSVGPELRAALAGELKKLRALLEAWCKDAETQRDRDLAHGRDVARRAEE